MTTGSSVLLTGATGFIGRHLAKHLAEFGCSVVSAQRSHETVSGVAETLVLPRLDRDAIAVALAGRQFRWVFHLAGYGVDPAERDLETMFRINVDLTRAVAEQSKAWEAAAVVVAGSGAEYDLNSVQEPVDENHPPEAFKMYGASKAAGSLCALAIARQLGVSLAVARLFGVFGPGEAAHRLLPSLMRGLHCGERVPLSPGLQRRDFLFVTDAVAALVATAAAIERAPQQLAVNVSSGEATQVRTFAEMVAGALNAPSALLGFGDIKTRADDVACFAGDPQRLFRLTGWKPAYSITRGIDATLAESARGGNS